MIYKGAATALFACAGAAQGEPSPEVARLPQWVVRAQERLALTPAQQRELRVLVDENSERMRTLQARYDSAAPRQAQREELALLQREFRENLSLILTLPQLAEWDVLLEELLGEVHLRNAPRLADGVH